MDCILCAVAEKSEEVHRLELVRHEGFIVSANLYPYNPGHLMIFPEEHIEDPREFNENDVLTLHKLSMIALDCLGKLYDAKSFNVGYNFGAVSGASLAHYHLHIVPRYSNENGFIDIVGGARIIVEDPNVTRERVAREFTRQLKH